MSKTKLALDIVENLRSLAESIEAVVNAMTSSDAAATTQPTENESPAKPDKQPDIKPDTPSEKAVTLVELRAFVAQRSTPENRPKIKEMLTRLGVKKLTELTEDKYAAVMREVAAL